MKLNLIVFLGFLAAVNPQFITNLSGTHPITVVGEIPKVIEGLVSQFPQYASKYQEALEIAKIVQAQSFELPQSYPIRFKRQTTSVNCTTLPNQIAQVQASITLTQAKIQNATVTLNTVSTQVNSYKAKVAVPSTNTTTNNNLLAIYQKLYNSTASSIANLNQQLTTQQSQLAQLQSDYNTFCVMTTTTAAPKNPCGTFVPYDSTNARTAPTVNGFVGGVYRDGSTAYVGFGDATSCNNQYLAPCAVSTSATSPGCFIPCGSNDINSLSSAYYLLADPALSWIGTDSSSISGVQNAVRILGPNNFMFGRALISGNYVVGKILYSNGAYSFQTYTNNGAVELTSGFDVLTCAIAGSCPCSNNASTITTTNAPVTQSPTVVQTPASTPILTTAVVTSAPTPVPTLAPTTTSSTTTQESTTTSTTSTASTTTSTTSTTTTEEPTTTSTTVTTTTLLPTILFTLSSGCNSDTLASGQSLNESTSLSSSNGEYQMALINGNLVVQNRTGYLIWQTNTTGSGATNMTMGSDGSLNLYNSTGFLVWSSSWFSNQTEAGSSLQLTNTGQFFVFKNSQVGFSSASNTSSRIFWTNSTWTNSTSSSNSSTVTSPPFDPSIYPCGTFMQYDSVNQRTFPDTYGFVGGFNYDNSNEYVGYGNNPCGNPLESKAPGFISTNAANPGAFMTCSSGLYKDISNAYFLLNNSNLQWINTSVGVMNSVNNKLGTNDSGNILFFGRYFYNGQYRLGKISPASGVDGFYFINERNVQIYIVDNFQILTCATISPTTVAPTPVPTLAPTLPAIVITPAPTVAPTSTTPAPTTPAFDPTSFPCGSYKKYDIINGVNDPVNFGFAAGTNYDLTVEYVGSGNSSCAPSLPGYIKVQNSPGAYTPCFLGNGYDTATPYYLLRHPRLAWVSVNATTVNTVTGKIGVLGNTNNIVGRYLYNFNNKYQVGRVFIGGTPQNFYFINENNGQSFSTSYEVLVCI